jgi:hypothetical protein
MEKGTLSTYVAHFFYLQAHCRRVHHPPFDTYDGLHGGMDKVESRTSCLLLGHHLLCMRISFVSPRLVPCPVHAQNRLSPPQQPTSSRGEE